VLYKVVVVDDDDDDDDLDVDVDVDDDIINDFNDYDDNVNNKRLEPQLSTGPVSRVTLTLYVRYLSAEHMLKYRIM